MNFDSNGRRLNIVIGRAIVAIALCATFLSASSLPAYAALTGTINGTVTDPTGAPVPIVIVTAISPSGHAATTTDKRGFFALTGLVPDTYTISFELQGYESSSISGVTVSAEQIVTQNQTLSKTLKTIGHVAAHGAGSAFQANQTTDTYTLTNKQIIDSQGKDNANNEVTLVGSLPGAETDASGYPSLRGGRENEIGFEYEGINYDEPYSNQFANSLLLNGVGSLNLSPGAGDASQGNSGTGVINLIAKRGTYPAEGMVSVEDASQTFYHDFIAELGFATPNGSFSNYFKYIGQRQAELYGEHNTNLDQIGEYGGNSFNTVDDYVDNMIYKFGKNQSKSLQLFYEGQNVQYQVGSGLPQSGTYFRTGDQAANAAISSEYYGGDLSPSQVGSLLAFYPGQHTADQMINGTPSYNQPLQALKLQFNENPDGASYYDLRFYRLSAVTTFDFPTTIPAPADVFSYQELQGGLRTGGAFDYNRQLNSKNLLSVGGHYDFDLPVNSNVVPLYGLLDTSGAEGLSAGKGFEALDFLPGGYLSQYFNGNPPRVPAGVTYEPYTRHEYGFYAKMRRNSTRAYVCRSACALTARATISEISSRPSAFRTARPTRSTRTSCSRASAPRFAPRRTTASRHRTVAAFRTRISRVR